MSEILYMKDESADLFRVLSNICRRAVIQAPIMPAFSWSFEQIILLSLFTSLREYFLTASRIGWIRYSPAVERSANYDKLGIKYIYHIGKMLAKLFSD